MILGFVRKTTHTFISVAVTYSIFNDIMHNFINKSLEYIKRSLPWSLRFFSGWTLKTKSTTAISFNDSCILIGWQAVFTIHWHHEIPPWCTEEKINKVVGDGWKVMFFLYILQTGWPCLIKTPSVLLYNPHFRLCPLTGRLKIKLQWATVME